jgi:hypothetical protein
MLSAATAYVAGEVGFRSRPVVSTLLLCVAVLIVALAAGRKVLKQDDRRVPPWVRLIAFTVAAFLAVIAGSSFYRDNIAVRPRATIAELREKYITNRTVYISDIPMTDYTGQTIEDKTFDNCTLIGPAVVHPTGCAMTDLRIGQPDTLDALHYEMDPTREWFIGAIQFRNVTLRHCSIAIVGFLMPDAEFAHLKSKTEYSGRTLEVAAPTE